MAGKVLKMNNMSKINNSAIINKSAENPPLLIHITVIPIIVSSCLNLRKQDIKTIKLNQHFESSEKILDWFDKGMPKNEIENLISLPGIEIMEDNVLLNNPDTIKIPTFEQDLSFFQKNPNDYKSKYGLNLAYQERTKTSKLLQKIQEADFDTVAIKRALEYFPNDTEIKTDANVYYVLTGWEWGDAYVRKIKKVNGKYKIEENGKSVLIFNLSLFTKLYGETTDEQFQTLTDIMSHELFHFAFNEFKKQSENYPHISKTDFKELLICTVQNEGIAHYIDRKEDLKANFDKFKKYQEKNFEKLNEALKLLSSKQIDDMKKNEILQKANVGKYWSKYGAISGMFMAYHIERILGKKAITKTIKNGAESFIKTYIELQSIHKELPELEIE